MLWAYCRVSSNKQLEGLSMSIQGDDKLLSSLAIQFDTHIGKRIYRDGGKSAYKGEHLRGELGQFLRDLESGYTSETNEKIGVGDILVIRHLDRLSRLNLADSMTLYNQILKAGIRIHTTMDGRTFSIDDPNDLQAAHNAIVGFVFANANEESKKKAYYIQKNTLARIEQFNSGARYFDGVNSYPYDLANGQIPFYLEKRGVGRNRYIVPKENELAAMRCVIEHYLEENGLNSCSRLMKEHGCRKDPQTVKQLLQSESLMGTRVAKVGDNTYRLRNYYPELCSEKEFKQIQLLIEKTREKYPPKQIEYKSVLCTNGLLRCRRCDKALVPARNYGRRVYLCRTVGCDSTYIGQNPLNRLIIRTIQDEFKGEKIQIRRELTDLSEKIALLETKLSAIDGKDNSHAFVFHEEEKASTQFFNMMDLKRKKAELLLLLEVLDVDTHDKWKAFDEGLTKEDDNSHRFKVRDFILRYIKSISCWGKNLVEVEFANRTVKYCLVVTNPRSRDYLYSDVKLVSDKQYQDLKASKSDALVRYITRDMIRNGTLNHLTLKDLESMGLVRDLKLLSKFGRAHRRDRFIASIKREIQSHDEEFLEWTNMSIVGRGLTSISIWWDTTIDELKLYSYLRFYKFAYVTIQGRVRMVEIVSSKIMAKEELERFYHSKDTIYFKEILSQEDKVAYGTRCHHIKEITKQYRAA